VETAALAAADKLADGIIAYDVSDQLVITDAFLLCSAPNDRQVKAIVDEIELRMRQAGASLVRREGEREGRWVLLDYLDVVIHAALRGAYLLRARADLEGLPGDPAARAEREPREDALSEPSRPVRLVLWRHGQTVWNAERRFQGQSDIPLDEVGQAQAERAARLLAALRPDLIVSSDLSRAAQTAAPLSRLTGLEVTLDKDLRGTVRRLLGKG
jgi:ribosome silencing factor RsfS/YbeB/iojap